MTNFFKVGAARMALERALRDQIALLDGEEFADASGGSDYRVQVREDGTFLMHLDGEPVAGFRIGVVALRTDLDPAVVEIYNHDILVGDQIQGKSGAWFPVEGVRFAANGDVLLYMDVNGRTVPAPPRNPHTKSKVRRCPDGVAADLIMHEFPNAEIAREDS